MEKAGIPPGGRQFAFSLRLEVAMVLLFKFAFISILLLPLFSFADEANLIKEARIAQEIMANQWGHLTGLAKQPNFDQNRDEVCFLLGQILADADHGKRNFKAPPGADFQKYPYTAGFAFDMIAHALSRHQLQRGCSGTPQERNTLNNRISATSVYVWTTLDKLRRESEGEKCLLSSGLVTSTCPGTSVGRQGSGRN